MEESDLGSYFEGIDLLSTAGKHGDRSIKQLVAEESLRQFYYSLRGKTSEASCKSQPLPGARRWRKGRWKAMPFQVKVQASQHV